MNISMQAVGLRKLGCLALMDYPAQLAL